MGSILTVDGLTKDFSGFVAVDDVDIAVEQGTIHGLIGPNGAGKTTTFRLITGEMKPSAGVVHFRGEDITGESPTAIARRGIGRSFQIVQYFPEMTVREHLRLAIRDATNTLGSIFDDVADYDARIEAVARRVQLGGRLDTVAENLSHGEKRYLDIGLVLGLDPELIFLDEPAAGLNQSETGVLEDILEELRGEYTLFVIEHDIELVRRLVDTLTVLNRGKVLATGSPAEITEHETVKEVYLGE